MATRLDLSRYGKAELSRVVEPGLADSPRPILDQPTAGAWFALHLCADHMQRSVLPAGILFRSGTLSYYLTIADTSAIRSSIYCAHATAVSPRPVTSLIPRLLPYSLHLALENAHSTHPSRSGVLGFNTRCLVRPNLSCSFGREPRIQPSVVLIRRSRNRAVSLT